MNPQPVPGLARVRPETEWRVRLPAPPLEVARLCRQLGVPPLLASVLWARGFRDDPELLLDPPLEPSAIPSLAEAAERLEATLRDNGRILVHGDYDADGISGTALLTLGLRSLGGNVTPFLPDRLTDGYGIHPRRVAEHAAAADLLVTVDCGISNLAEIEALTEAGVEVIVTDHHQPGPELPDCLVVHPRVSPQSDPLATDLTGAGVAFHLLWALHLRLGLDAPLEYADIATLGTVADVAPLLGANRALIKEGLKRLPHSAWPGIRASLTQTGLRNRPTARDVAFVLAPRLNAAGRLGEAEFGLELLTTASERRARELAAYLDARNSDRRRIQDDMFREAQELADATAPALVLGSDGWHPGVMGIVASKLVETFYKPVFIMAEGKGSVRSTPGISAVEALRSASAHLLRFGGHSQAAGFSIADDQVASFTEAVHDYVGRHPRPQPTVTADGLISADEIGADLYRAIREMEPFGEGHPAPTFALSGPLEMARAVGSTRSTLQLRLGGVKGVAWQQGKLAESLPPGATVNVAASLQENVWNQTRSIEFVASEIRLARPLSFEAGSTAKDRIHRGRPPAAASELTDPWSSPAAGETLWIRRLPLSDPAAPASGSEALTVLVGSGATLYIDLIPDAVAAIRRRCALFPTVSDLRRGFVCLQRGLPLPFDEAKNSLVRTVLGELGLFDRLGRPLSGQKRDPYGSATLVEGLMERYRLRGLLNAYLMADDAGFASCVTILFS